MSALRLRVALGRTFEKGVGQIVEGDGFREREQLAGLGVEMRLQGRAVRQQAITHPIELVEVEVREVCRQQLPQTTALG